MSQDVRLLCSLAGVGVIIHRARPLRPTVACRALAHNVVHA